MRDLVRFISTALILILAYLVLVGIAAPRVSLTGLPDGERNLVIAERYVYAPETPAAVIVGSSMSRRLGYGDDARLGQAFYNLALDGDGPLTGLALIAAKRDKPRIVIVETNWLRRPLDRELVDEVAGYPQRFIRVWVPALRQEFKPATLLRAINSGRINVPQPTDLPKFDEDRDADTAGVPASLRYTIAHFGGITPATSERINAGVDQLRQQVADLRAIGVRVILVFFPMHHDLEASPAFQETQAALEKAFPADRFEWLTLPDRDSYHTVDSVHLTYLSAIRLTFFLRAATQTQ